jgi:zinc protease
MAIQKYSKDDADKCYASIFDPKNAVITLAGNISTERVTTACGKIYKSIAGKKNDFKDVRQKTELNNYGKVIHAELDNPQTTILFALPGTLRTSADRFATGLANVFFGAGGFISRLPKRLRDRDGLVYRIDSSIVDKDLQSYVSVIAKTRPENTADVIKAVKEECRILFEKGLTQEELSTCKTYIYAAVDLVSNADKVRFVSNCRAANVPLEGVNGYLRGYFDLTLDDVNTAIKKVFDPNKVVSISCGKSNQESTSEKRNEAKKENEEEKK